VQQGQQIEGNSNSWKFQTDSDCGTSMITTLKMVIARPPAMIDGVTKIAIEVGDKK
jgi:hypothetical protein